MIKKVLAVLTVAALAVLGLAACAPRPASTTFTVVATTTQVTEFTRTVVGDAGRVIGLLQPNQSAHSFDPSAAQMVALSQADALVINGAGLEPWVGDLISAAGFTGTVIDASAGITLVNDDPHVFTDPLQARQMVASIASGLSSLALTSPKVTDPSASAAAMEARAAIYEQKLTTLNQWALESFAQVPAAQRLLVTNHDAFTYFVDAYGITFIGSIIPSMDDNAEPSAAEIDRLVTEITSSGATAVFSEASISPKLAETISTEAGVAVYSGEDALYSDSLGAPGSAGETYILATVHNVTVLLNSWGYQPLPLPKELG